MAPAQVVGMRVAVDGEVVEPHLRSPVLVGERDDGDVRARRPRTVTVRPGNEWSSRPAVRASERQRVSGQQRPAWPGNADTQWRRYVTRTILAVDLAVAWLHEQSAAAAASAAARARAGSRRFAAAVRRPAPAHTGWRRPADATRWLAALGALRARRRRRRRPAAAEPVAPRRGRVDHLHRVHGAGRRRQRRVRRDQQLHGGDQRRARATARSSPPPAAASAACPSRTRRRCASTTSTTSSRRRAATGS